MSHFISHLEEQWIPWAKLKCFVPFAEIYSEFLNIKKRAVEHRLSYSVGWRSLTLHGLRPEWTESAERYPGFEQFTDTTAPNQWTEIADICPETKKFLLSLPFKKFHRVRFMWLEPGGYIKPHRDTHLSTLRALNIAIEHPLGCHFDFWKNDSDTLPFCTVPFKNGDAYFVNIGLRHQFVNPSKEGRLHIIVHGATNEEFSQNTEQYIEKVWQ